jgi:hypothetical protein
MKPSAMLHWPLASAFLCADCDSIGNCSARCPACAGNSLLALSNCKIALVKTDVEVRQLEEMWQQ